MIPTKDDDNKTTKDTYVLINTSGKTVTKDSRNKDGNDYYYVVDGGRITAIYTED